MFQTESREVSSDGLSAPELLRKSSQGFQYQPLDHVSGDDFRLVCLYPGTFADPLRCDLFHASLDVDIEFEAISYTWSTEEGDTTLSTTVACAYLGEDEAADLRITANCASALRRLRPEAHERIIWLDAIAIDQSNVEERNHQVKLMASIYSQARQVLVYLGEEDLGFGSRGLWVDQAKRTAALAKLFAKNWVHRVWVIQEVALAQKVMMVTGSVVVHMDNDFMARLRGRAKAAGLDVPGPLAWDPIASAPTRDLLTMLNMTKNCRSTDPRDKVYGLMGLTGERLQTLLKVDYAQSIDEVFTRTAAAIIVLREDLEILAYSSSTTNSDIKDRSLPSWVPDWTVHRGGPTVNPQFRSRHVGPWNSSKQWSLGAPASEDGIDWNKVAYVPPVWSRDPSDVSFLTVQGHRIAVIDSMYQEDSHPLAQGQCADTFRLRLLELLFSHVEPHTWPSQYQWLVRGIHARRKMNFDTAIDVYRSDRGALTSSEHAELQSFCTELERLGKDMHIYCAHHLPAIARPGFEIGDCVYAVNGCATLLILRPVGDKNLYKFRIVCGTYLLSLPHIDCWITSGRGSKQQWDFDPFRQMSARDSRTIEIY